MERLWRELAERDERIEALTRELRAITNGTGWALLLLLWRVRFRLAPRGTLGYALSSLHVPFIVAMLVANLPGDILIGMMGLGQIALWSALIVRSGHHAIEAGQA